jgi:hypothetical protein
MQLCVLDQASIVDYNVADIVVDKDNDFLCNIPMLQLVNA